MAQLITVSEFSTLKHISKKVDSDRITQAIKEACDIDLYDYLGNFYFDVVQNKDEVAYQELMDGSIFTVDNEDYIHEGIKALVADLAYARYLYLSNVNDTPFGLVSKSSNDSTPIDRNVIKDLVKQAQVDAGIKFTLVDKYLEENASTFTRYTKGENPNINTFSQRFDVI